MKKITVISDGLVKKEFFEEAIGKIDYFDEFTIEYFDWYGELEKSEFQKKIDYIEKNGPDDFEPNEKLLKSLSESTYLFAHIAPINNKMLSVCKKLEIIGICRGGTENIDLEFCKKNNITVIRAVKNAIATAEFTVGLMIDLTRNIAIGNSKLRENIWLKKYFNDNLRRSLQEMTVGVVGLGSIGTEVARILAHIGATVIAYHPNITEEKKKEINFPIKYECLDDLLKNSDIVTLHLRVSEETKNILSMTEFKKMKKSSYLINTARAALVNESDLINALKSKEILGAALDVFWEEPIHENNELIKLDNVLLTPHIAGDTDVINKAPTILLREVITYLEKGYSPMKIKDKYMVN
ncbi:NAD(P)-dependent oxidoreductase [Aerococcaceae bacterium WGS1372]